MTANPAFGPTLKAFRLGYRIPEGRDFLLMIADGKWKDTFRVILLPIGERPPKSTPKTHYAWYDSKKRAEKLFSLAPVLRSIKKVKVLVDFHLDMDGRIVKS